MLKISLNIFEKIKRPEQPKMENKHHFFYFGVPTSGLVQSTKFFQIIKGSPYMFFSIACFFGFERNIQHYSPREYIHKKTLLFMPLTNQFSTAPPPIGAGWSSFSRQKWSFSSYYRTRYRAWWWWWWWRNSGNDAIFPTEYPYPYPYAPLEVWDEREYII